MIMAHEIQGVIALENAFNRVGLDHVQLVKVASTAVTAKLMGANREHCLHYMTAVPLAFGNLVAEQVAVEYPIGHRRRRLEGIPLLEDMFKANLATRFTGHRSAEIFALCKDQVRA